MNDVPPNLIEGAAAAVSAVPGRLIYGVNASTPIDYLRQLPLVGITRFGVSSVAQARRVRDTVPEAEVILSLHEATPGIISQAYRALGIRSYRLSRVDDLNLLLDTTRQADDLAISVQLPPRSGPPHLSESELHTLKELLFAARSAADRLGLGYNAGSYRVTAEEQAARMEVFREAIVAAAVTVDVIDLRGGGPLVSERFHNQGVAASFDPIVKAFESLPISYSAELWLQPDHAFFDREILDGWEVAVDDAPPRKRKAERFFISYASEQEPLAREVLSVIESRGHDATVQFRDFPQASFVRSMREGIEHADRFVAIQSKQYWMSDHCQAEWDAAYARDPAAKRRFIVPFLVEPTPLPPIASELVYKSLVGLNERQRREAIGDWIDYKPRHRSRAQLRRALAKQASPDVRVHDRRIDAGPNSRFDRPLVDEDLAELPANLRALIDTLLDALPPNTPPIVRSCLGGYRQHLIERGTQPILGTVVPFADAIELQTKADAGLWDVGLERLFEHFFRRHQLLVTHFPLNPERELLLTETVIDEFSAAGARIMDPVSTVGRAIEQLRDAGLTTREFDDAEQAHQEFSRDIASLPMAPAGPDTRITPKRRFVLGTIGFYERVLAALGGVASIGGVALLPPVQATVTSAADALKSAIEAFLAFVK